MIGFVNMCKHMCYIKFKFAYDVMHKSQIPLCAQNELGTMVTILNCMGALQFHIHIMSILSMVTLIGIALIQHVKDATQVSYTQFMCTRVPMN